MKKIILVTLMVNLFSFSSMANTGGGTGNNQLNERDLLIAKVCSSYGVQTCSELLEKLARTKTIKDFHKIKNDIENEYGNII